MRLSDLKKNELAEIIKIHHECPKEMKQRLLDLGFVPGAEIFIENISPLNDPISYSIFQTQISLRKKDADFIEIQLKNN